MSFFEKILELVGFFKILLSFTLLGFIFGGITYYVVDGQAGIILGCCIALMGLIFGIYFANKILKTTGTMNFLSRVDASPDLDNLKREEEEK